VEGVLVGPLRSWRRCVLSPAQRALKVPATYSKAFALTWYRALTWYSLRLSPPRTHFEHWKAVGTRGRGSLAAR